MVEAAKTSSSLHEEKCNIKNLVLNKIFYLVVFSCIRLSLNAKYTSEKRIAK